MATVSDRTLPEAVTGTPTAVRGYTADIVTASDYYPFGMVSRAFNSPSVNYRYGFNGKEVDNEMFGIGDELDYGMRVYDPRVGRFLSVDPITKSYPELTPYQFASNSPIQGIDLDGLELLKVNSSIYQRKYDGALTIFGKVDHLYTVEIVKQNIPTSIKDQVGNWKYNLDAGSVGGYGSDLPGAYFKYGKSQPDFWGKGSDVKSTRGIERLSPNVVPGRNSTLADAIAPGASTAQHLGGMLSNVLNNSVWTGLTKEKDDRSAFYLATNIVEASFSNQPDNGKFKADLTNFLTDGTLPALDPDEMKSSLMERKNIMDKGMQLMEDHKIRLKPETQKTYDETIKSIQQYERQDKDK